MTERTKSVSQPSDADWPEIGRFIARLQGDPSHHVTYVGIDAATILAELAEAPSWKSRTLIIWDGVSIGGVIVCDLDAEKRRAYWLGPWAEDEDLTAHLLDEARTRFGDLFDEEELAPDARNRVLGTLAIDRGFRAEVHSDVLSLLNLPAGPVTSQTLSPEHVEAVAALHDSLFPGTHRSGAHLTDDGTQVRCVIDNGTPVGYIAFQVQADGSGYIDYLGVEPTARRRGIARTLIRDACSELATLGVSNAHLTVRADLPGAIELYVSEGFIRERTIAPYRLGF